MIEKTCAKCGKPFETKSQTAVYCSRTCSLTSDNGRGKKKRNRPFTPDTAFLCQLYRQRGESIRQIARDMERTEESVWLALETELTSSQRETLAEDVYRRGCRCVTP